MAAIFAFSSSSTLLIFQSAGMRATSNRNCCSVRTPFLLCTTSGWYCSPYSRRAAHSMATMVPCAVFVQSAVVLESCGELLSYLLNSSSTQV